MVNSIMDSITLSIAEYIGVLQGETATVELMRGAGVMAPRFLEESRVVGQGNKKWGSVPILPLKLPAAIVESGCKVVKWSHTELTNAIKHASKNR